MSNSRHRPTGGAAGRRRLAQVAAAALALAGAPGAVLMLAPQPLAAQAGVQQTGRVTGTVTGDAGQPLPAVQLSIVGTGLGAATGDDGRYTIAGVAPGTYQVRAQRIGYAPTTQQVTVVADQAATADFQLRQTVTTLTTQVVVGYTTQQRRDVSDATAGVQGDEIRDQKVATVEEALRGRIPGVQVQASGEPGRAPSIVIRGQNFFGATSPLYVVDGMYMTQNPNLNPDEIESIEVLKDASAAAQYGAQAANGVVVVRTKRGRAGETRADLSSYYGYQDVPQRIDMMSAREWATVYSQALDNANAQLPADKQIAVPADLARALAGQTPNTDWQDAILRTGAIQNYSLGVSGGTLGASYLLSGGYLKQEGAIANTGFDRYSFRANLEQRRGRFAFGQNLAVSRSNKRNPVGAPLIDAIRMLPTIPVRTADNSSGWGYGTDASPTFGTNPVAVQFVRPSTYRSNQVIGTGYGEVGLFGGLKYRLQGGVNYNAAREQRFQSIAQVRYRTPNQFAEFEQQRFDFTSLLLEHLLSFDRQVGAAHRLNAVAGYTYQRNDNETQLAFRQGYQDENLRTINAGELAGQRTDGDVFMNRLEGVLLRANYVLLDRYLVTGSARRDGSSKFGRGNQYGTFGAVSLGWVASEEPFFRSIPIVGRSGFLKFRASHGELGNSDIGDYGLDARVNQGLNYIIGGGTTVSTGVAQSDLANPNRRWQSNTMTNAGFDLGVMDGRVNLALDWYESKAGGLLVDIPIPSSLGASNSPTVNAGTMRNRGLELGLTHKLERGDFRLNSTLTYTTVRNKVLSLGAGEPIPGGPGDVTRTIVGQPLGSFYVVKTAGIFQSQAEIDAYKIQPDARPGDIRYVDVNGDGVFNVDDDRYFAGNGTPRYSGGLFLEGGWKSLDVGLNLRGAGGNKIFNGVRYWTDRMDDPSGYRAGLRPWTPENRSTTTPRALAIGSDNTIFASDRWIEDGDYLRVQNVVFGYRLPPSLTRRFGGQAAAPRIYLNVQNLHTFTDFSNWDPESLGNGGALERGIDDARVFPNVRTVTIGLDLRM